ncbi:MAG: hypothetical protein ABJA75_18945 [Bradyrhizobium sp.]
MILVAGGQLDFNIGALLRRMLRRRVKFVTALLGPKLVPRLTIDLAKDRLKLDGKVIRPHACFMRHDVFLGQALHTMEANNAAMNWYVAIKGWELGRCARLPQECLRHRSEQTAQSFSRYAPWSGGAAHIADQ